MTQATHLGKHLGPLLRHTPNESQENPMFQTLLRRWSKAPTQSVQAVPSVGSPEQPTPLPTRSSADRSPVRGPRLAVVVCDLADEVHVRLQGEAGYLEGRVLDAALLPVSARRPALVTFDLSELHSMSSLVMGILVQFRRNAAQKGGRVRLTALRPEVREAIERAELAKLFLEHNAAEEARAGAQQVA
jgi:anti-anti-sigma factor